jgi:hypothetical protein
MRRDLGIRRDEQHKGPPPHRSVRASEGQVRQSESPRVLGTGGRAEGLLDKATRPRAVRGGDPSWKHDGVQVTWVLGVLVSRPPLLPLSSLAPLSAV